MASLADLLRYKKLIDVHDPRTNEVIKTVWIRVLGDLDLTNAYKASRLASATKRSALRDIDSEDYKDEVLGVEDLAEEEKKDLIKTAKLSNIISEALVAIERPDVPKLSEIAINPDAASLEELEKFDIAEKKVEVSYRDKIDEYIRLRTEEIEVELQLLSIEELTSRAKQEVSVLVPFSLFMSELNVQKAFYGTFQDQTCKIREFETIDDFRQLPKSVQEMLIEEINNLEVSGADVKN